MLVESYFATNVTSDVAATYAVWLAQTEERTGISVWQL